jgi:hypothetical protein
VLLKEQPGQLSYALYSSTDSNRPSGHVFTTGDIGLQGPAVLPANTWSHLAMTWDGLTIRVYVNGAQVASGALAGLAVPSASPLRIGGNSVWGEWFAGLIDEVRVYNRALTAAEIAGDRDTAIAGGAGLLAARSALRAPKVRKATRFTRDGARRRAHRPHWIKGRSARRSRRSPNQAVGRR